MDEQLLSVGIDIGTTTTQLVISRLTLRNSASAYTVPEISIAEKEVLYRSEIHFTPLLSRDVIDTEGVRQIVAAEYNRSGYAKTAIATGAVIITGETARKENAKQVLSALAEFAGDFVVATAGPALESILAGKGAGAAQYSAEQHCAVLNFDIGGGTSNLALFRDGELLDTGCLNVGGRLIKLSQEHRITYISPVLDGLTELRLGQLVTEVELRPVAELLADVLAQAVGLRPKTALLDRFITDKNVSLGQLDPLFSFSGGVADLIAPEPQVPWGTYGDIGVLLGQAIAASPLLQHGHISSRETIRATVIGAGSHSTQLSGSTVHYDGVDFPIKNLPVLSVSKAQEQLEDLAGVIREKLEWFQGEPVVLALPGEANPSFQSVCRLAEAIVHGLPQRPMIVAVRHDMGKALGQAISCLVPEVPVVCLDGIRLSTGDYLDIGHPAMGGTVLPVVVKTLVLS